MHMNNDPAFEKKSKEPKMFWVYQNYAKVPDSKKLNTFCIKIKSVNNANRFDK